MAESLTPREPNRVLQAIADALARAKGALNWAPDVRTSAALAAGAPAPSSLVGDLVLGQAPEEVERWAHGSSPFKSSFPGISGRLPEVQDRRKAALVDALLATAPGATAYGKAGVAAARQAPPAFGAFAVKPKGGMWSPKATQELADPLEYKLLGSVVRAEALMAPGEPLPAAAAWARKAAERYLNKHAGTVDDPLKDIEIPYSGSLSMRGGGTERWETATDAAIGVQPAYLVREELPPDSFARIPRREPVYDLSGHRVSAPMGLLPEAPPFNPETTFHRNAITRYLSHVGDYLRQYVPPEKLQHYDLVRAVRETAAQDQRLAREAAKEAGKVDAWKALQQSFLPVVKSYPAQQLPERTVRIGKPDARGLGLSNTNSVKVPAETLDLQWVEFKLPERLTPEQANTIKLQLEFPEGEASGTPKPVYRPLDGSGKIIRNSFTNRLVHGDTPEEAWLSGQMALEGNSLAHCVGGYCKDVVGGKSRILSLRDSKGRSLATLETRPYRTNAGRGQIGVDTVSQIKGPGNQAVAAEYRPYLLDFLNSQELAFSPSGLQDLEMHNFVKTPRGIMDRKAAESFFGQIRNPE